MPYDVAAHAAEGLCRYCTRRATPGKHACRTHLGRLLVKMQAARAAQKARGLCYHPGCQHPPAPGRGQCHSHLTADAAKMRARRGRRKEGILAGRPGAKRSSP